MHHVCAQGVDEHLIDDIINVIIIIIIIICGWGILCSLADLHPDIL